MFHHIAEEVDTASLEQQGEVAQIIRMIKHHEQELVTLRKRLNSFLWASRIPDDILVEVSRHSIRIAHEPHWKWQCDRALHWTEEEEECPEELRWWSVPLVCQRWRNLVMSNPGLWSLITSYDRPGYGLSAIKHSMSAGLRLFLIPPPFGGISLSHKLLEQLHRTSSLEYCFNHRVRCDPEAMVRPPHAFDKLRTLYLWCRDDDKTQDLLRKDLLIRSLEEAPLPNLTTLILERIPTYGYSMFIRPTITSLEIGNNYRRCGFGEFGAVSMLSVLSGLPLLRVLRLCFPTPPKPRQDTYGTGLVDVHLPHLQEFDLRTQSDACLLFLHRLSFPLDANISISPTGTWSPFPTWDLSLPRFKIDYQDTNLVDNLMERLTSLRIDHLPPPYRLLLEEAKGGDGRYEHKKQISSRTGHGFTIWTNSAYVERIIDRFPLHHVEEVEFRGMTHTFGIEDNSRHWSRNILATSVVLRGTTEEFEFFLSSLTPQELRIGRLTIALRYPI